MNSLHSIFTSRPATISKVRGPIVFFKRSGSRGFHDLIYQYLFYFHKRYEYCKTGELDICVSFSRFLATFSW